MLPQRTQRWNQFTFWDRNVTFLYDYKNIKLKKKTNRKTTQTPHPKPATPHNNPPKQNTISALHPEVCINAVTNTETNKKHEVIVPSKMQCTSTVLISYLQASRYPPIMEVGWIFCFTSSSAFLRSSAAIITCLKYKYTKCTYSIQAK